MRRSLWCAVTTLVLGSATGFADIPPPPSPSTDGHLIIQVDDGAGGPVLVVPPKFVKKAAADSDSTDAIGAATPGAFPRIAIAGIALAAAVACGGLWLLRRNRSGGANVILALAGLGALIGGAWVMANAPAPPFRRHVPKTVYESKIRVEMPNGGTSFVLVISHADLKALNEKAQQKDPGAAPTPPTGSKPK
jgi:hypothetical protein